MKDGLRVCTIRFAAHLPRALVCVPVLSVFEVFSIDCTHRCIAGHADAFVRSSICEPGDFLELRGGRHSGLFLSKDFLSRSATEPPVPASRDAAIPGLRYTFLNARWSLTHNPAASFASSRATRNLSAPSTTPTRCSA